MVIKLRQRLPNDDDKLALRQNRIKELSEGKRDAYLKTEDYIVSGQRVHIFNLP